MRYLLVMAIAALVGCQNSDVSRSIGARCNTSSECDGRCLPPSADWPDGFCTLVCDDNSACPEGTRCIDEAGGVCAFTCSDDPGCSFLGIAYVCKQRDSKGSGVKAMVCHGN